MRVCFLKFNASINLLSLLPVYLLGIVIVLTGIDMALRHLFQATFVNAWFLFAFLAIFLIIPVIELIVRSLLGRWSLMTVWPIIMLEAYPFYMMHYIEMLRHFNLIFFE